MNPIYSLVVLVAFGSRIMAADVGLYDISDASHPQILRDQLGEATISSQSNDNRSYHLRIHAAHFFSLPYSRVGLVVGNVTIRFNTQDRDDKGRLISMGATVEDPKVVPQIAQYLHAKITKRRHPGHRMLVEFIPDKAEFALGEPVTVKLRITNIGDRDFAFIEGGRQRGARDNQFAFSAELIGKKMIPDTGDPLHLGGLGSLVTLKAGQSHEIAIDLTRWFDFKQTGMYLLRGSYHMDFFEPTSEDLDPIWEDYACAEFTIQIKS
jgi:hypothetical protein